MKEITLTFDDDIPEGITLPYIKVPSQKLFTLVLDMDETLIHFEEVENTGYGRCLI